MPKGKRSRKGKKAWRKNVDVEEEEDTVRLRETEDSQLFVIDKPTRAEILSRKQKKEKVAKSILFEEKYTTPIGKNKLQNIPKKTEANKHIQRLAANLASTKEKTSEKKESKPKLFDLWGSDEIKPRSTALKRSRNNRENILESTLTTPDPGQSYRPRKEDHQNLLTKALDQVSKKLEPDMYYGKKMEPTAPRRPDVEIKWNFSDSEDDEENMDEKSLGDLQNEVEEEKLKERMKKIQKNFSTKLTKTERNQLKKKKLMAKKQRLARKKGSKFDRLDALLASIDEQEEKQKEKIEKRHKTKEHLSKQPKKLGKLGYSEKPIDFLYSDELPTSMRKLKVRKKNKKTLKYYFQKLKFIFIAIINIS